MNFDDQEILKVQEGAKYWTPAFSEFVQNLYNEFEAIQNNILTRHGIEESLSVYETIVEEYISNEIDPNVDLECFSDSSFFLKLTKFVFGIRRNGLQSPQHFVHLFLTWVFDYYCLQVVEFYCKRDVLLFLLICRNYSEFCRLVEEDFGAKFDGEDLSELQVIMDRVLCAPSPQLSLKNPQVIPTWIHGNRILLQNKVFTYDIFSDFAQILCGEQRKIESELLNNFPLLKCSQKLFYNPKLLSWQDISSTMNDILSKADSGIYDMIKSLFTFDTLNTSKAIFSHSLENGKHLWLGVHLMDCLFEGIDPKVTSMRDSCLSSYALSLSFLDLNEFWEISCSYLVYCTDTYSSRPLLFNLLERVCGRNFGGIDKVFKFCDKHHLLCKELKTEFYYKYTSYVSEKKGYQDSLLIALKSENESLIALHTVGLLKECSVKNDYSILSAQSTFMEIPFLSQLKDFINNPTQSSLLSFLEQDYPECLDPFIIEYVYQILIPPESQKSISKNHLQKIFHILDRKCLDSCKLNRSQLLEIRKHIAINL